MEPRLVYSEMTGRWYIATRYSFAKPPAKPGLMIASKKYDVADQIDKLFPNRLLPSEICPQCSYPRLRPDLIEPEK